MPALQAIIESSVSKATGAPFRIASSRSLGGGCIHDARCVTGVDGRHFFIKQNIRSRLASFETEARALEVLAAADAIRVPEPVTLCSTGDQAALILEFLQMGSGKADWKTMGRNLALLHRKTGPEFGWSEDNWLGASPQANAWESDWVSFYREYRLAPQVRWARGKGLPLRQMDALIELLPAFFRDYTPSPSLLHGDLWSGNAGFLQDGTPVIYDPATYYGDREADLAMTEMFGGFPGDFYRGYDSEWPVNPGYRIRKDLYNLYHLLNHYNIFGGGYGHQAESTIRRLLDSLS